MTVTTSRMIQITDDRGKFPNHEYDKQPPPGSVVLTSGQWGTAWQRYFSDGRWHCTRGEGSRTWAELLRRRNLVLVYEAPVRPGWEDQT